MVSEAPTTAAGWLEAAAARLREAGVPDPRREAARLAEAAWRLKPGQARAHPGRPTVAAEGEHLLELARRRAAGEPLAYVTGSIGFRTLELRIDRRALIPRPETEGLVDLVLERMGHGVAADIGTGSGCIALSLAFEGRYDRVIGTDASADALALARENGQRTGGSVEWRLGDLLGPLRDDRVDLLVSNPPYLTRAEHDALDPSVRDWEPSEALASGEDGLDATRRLLRDGMTVVRPGGWLALEVDCQRAAAVAALAAGLGWTDPAVHQDLYGRARYVLARRSETS